MSDKKYRDQVWENLESYKASCERLHVIVSLSIIAICFVVLAFLLVR